MTLPSLDNDQLTLSNAFYKSKKVRMSLNTNLVFCPLFSSMLSCNLDASILLSWTISHLWSRTSDFEWKTFDLFCCRWFSKLFLRLVRLIKEFFILYIFQTISKIPFSIGSCAFFISSMKMWSCPASLLFFKFVSAKSNSFLVISTPSSPSLTLLFILGHHQPFLLVV